jgi:hypothetical protein
MSNQGMGRVAALVQPVCLACDKPVYHAAKSHTHYTHRDPAAAAGCAIRRVEKIRMHVIRYRDES